MTGFMTPDSIIAHLILSIVHQGEINFTISQLRFYFYSIKVRKRSFACKVAAVFKITFAFA